MFIKILWSIYILIIIGCWLQVFAISKKLKREHGEIYKKYHSKKITFIEKIAGFVSFFIITIIPIFDLLLFSYLISEQFYEAYVEKMEEYAEKMSE